ncbi:MAG: discoidin domain-containing protein, partial [Oscillospiraceae bacterium]
MKKIISLLICTMILMTGMTGVKVSAAELPNLALNKSATASTIWSDSFSADKAFDGDTNSRWGSKGTASEYWITVDLESVQAINKMAIDEYDARIGAFQILYSNDGQNWKVGYEGRMTGTSSANHRRKTFEFEEFEGRYIKLSTTEATKEITIWEIGLYFDAEKSDSGNVASGKTATASTIKSEEYKADNVTDNSNTTFWKPGDGDTTPNIMIDLEKIVPINYIRILEEKDNISKLHIEYSTDNLVWTTAKDAVCSATGAVSNRDSRIEFPAINARYVKITVSESIAPASIGNIRIACARSCDTFWYYKAASAINESVITS